MKKKLVKILGVGLTLTLLVSLLGVVTPAMAADNDWATTYGPSYSDLLGRQRAAYDGSPTSYVGGPIAQAINGTLYAYALTNVTLDPVASNLFRSTTDGHTWSDIGEQMVDIVDIACSPTDKDILYIATAQEVRASIDGGETFVTKVSLAAPETITGIDVAELGGNHMVLIGTCDPTALGVAPWGNVYLFNEGAYPAALTDMVVGNIDVLDVAMSPDFGTDQGIFAVGLSSTTDLEVMNKQGAAAWGANLKNETLKANTTAMASIAFPDDYSATTSGMANWYVGYNGTGAGADNITDKYEGIFLVIGDSVDTIAVKVSTQIDVSSLAVTGNTGSLTMILAGLTDGTVTYTNTGNTPYNLGMKKQPTGAANAMVVMDSDFASNGKAWAATSSTEGGVSITENACLSFNQVGLINTSTPFIKDVSITDGTIFIATATSAGLYSIWRHDGSWERVFCETLAGADLDLVEMSPDYDSDSTVFVGDIGGQQIWRSVDGGDIWVTQHALVSTTATITAWVVMSPTELIVGCTDEYTYRTTNNGLTWTKSLTDLGDDPYCIVASPTTAGAYLMGDDAGDCYYTADSGSTWTNSSPTATGNMMVTYGPTNSRWATSDAGGVYRYTYPSWKQIDDLTAGSDDIAEGTGIVFGSDGTLYVADSDDGTVSRCLPGDTGGGNMGSTTGLTADKPYFEVMNAVENPTTGTGVPPVSGMWLTGDNKVWTVIAYSVYPSLFLSSYVDTMNVPVTGIEVTPDAIEIDRATITWDDMAGAPTGTTEYYIQLSTREDFNLAFTDYSAGLTLPTSSWDSLRPGTVYYVRVRAEYPLRSLYSDAFSFTTVLGQPFGSADWVAPAPGAQNVTPNPVFTWAESPGATGYEFQLTEDPGFYETPSLLLENATPTINTYVGLPLAYSTTYYWRVRATGTDTESAWTNGVFTTMDKPEDAAPIVITEPGETTIEIVQVPVETIVQQPIPSYILWTVVAIGALLIIALIILIVRTRRVA